MEYPMGYPIGYPMEYHIGSRMRAAFGGRPTFVGTILDGYFFICLSVFGNSLYCHHAHFPFNLHVHMHSCQ